jgi:hypothetical protein
MTHPSGLPGRLFLTDQTWRAMLCNTSAKLNKGKMMGSSKIHQMADLSRS